MEQTGTATSFEFSAMQNENIRMLAKRMKFVGIFYIVVGVLLGIVALFMLFTVPFVSVVYVLATVAEILIGVWTLNAASSFRMIVETTGSDIAHLNNALESLRKLYNLQFWLLVVMIVLFIVGLIVGIGGGLLMMSEMSNGA